MDEKSGTEKYIICHICPIREIYVVHVFVKRREFSLVNVCLNKFFCSSSCNKQHVGSDFRKKAKNNQPMVITLAGNGLPCVYLHATYMPLVLFLSCFRSDWSDRGECLQIRWVFIFTLPLFPFQLRYLESTQKIRRSCLCPWENKNLFGVGKKFL